MTKDEVLSILNKTEAYVSGEQISKELGISRAAVNQAVKALRDDGYGIESKTRLGYKLISSPDSISYGELVQTIDPMRLKNVVILDSVDSTNNRLKSLEHEGAPSGTVVIADYQESGKGRRGRSFVSPKGSGIYLSYLLRPECSAEEISSLTAFVAVAVAKSLEAACDIAPQIKWVNDILVDGRKLVGILTELSVESESGAITGCVIGIGINVNLESSDFPEELRDKATSLSIVKGERIKRSIIISELISRIDLLQEDFPSAKDEYLDYYRSHCPILGKTINVYKIIGKDPVSATAQEITDNFSLKVRYEDGSEEDLRSGEVTIRGANGYI
ncbi:MAG: biotin--[acetyl-CoA-carboxylase] ligase [Clostridiales bacterium]|nr:biotin--[acetyl-CoA-carboxylase] ligase [Clostridiales bacterium]